MLVETEGYKTLPEVCDQWWFDQNQSPNSPEAKERVSLPDAISAAQVCIWTRTGQRSIPPEERTGLYWLPQIRVRKDFGQEGRERPEDHSNVVQQKSAAIAITC